MAEQIDVIIEELRKISTSMEYLRDNFAEFKTEVRTSLTETNGKMKGNFELMDKSIIHLEKQNELQHDALKAEVHSLMVVIDGHKVQINRLFDLDRERSKREDDMQLAILEKVNSIITDTVQRVTNESKESDVALDKRICRLEEDSMATHEALTVAKTTRNIAVAIMAVLIPYLIGGTVAGIKLWAIVMGGGI